MKELHKNSASHLNNSRTNAIALMALVLPKGAVSGGFLEGNAIRKVRRVMNRLSSRV